MLLSLSRDTQFEVVRVPIDASGNAIIDPNSDIAKTFFKVVDGHLVYKGRYAEVGYELGIAEDGIPRFGILATDEGKGLSSILGTESVTTKTTEYITRELPDTVVNHFDVMDDYDIDPPPFIPIFGRTPLEKTKKGITPFADYGYFGKTKINRDKLKKDFSDSLKDNPDAILDEKIELTQYLDKQTKEHKKVIEDLAMETGPMNPDCRLSICIPAAGAQEVKNIYTTLENFLNQSAKKDSFEIIVFVNKPDKDKEGKEVQSDGTYDEVLRFIKEHPEINVRVCHKTLPRSEALIGNIRKILNDTIVYRRNQLGTGDRNKKHFILSNDADNRGVVSEYVQNFINKFDSNENTDALMGQLDWDIESYARNPVVHIGTRLMQFVELQHRNESIASSGANFAFRTESYAAVGGYDSTCSKCEDVYLGRALKAARLGSHKRQAIKFAGAMVSRIFTSSRRAEKAVKDVFSPYEQWNGEFGALDDEVRKTDWAKVTEEIDYKNKESVQKLISGIESVINKTASAMINTDSLSDRKDFRKAMGWLGIKYKVGADNKIKIVNADKLIESLEKYQDNYKIILEKKLKNKKL